MERVYFFRTVLLFLLVGLLLVGGEFWFVLCLPKPDFKVTVGLLDGVNDADVVAEGTQVASTISLALTCETSKSFLPRSSIKIAVFVDGVQVEAIQYCPSSNIYPIKEGNRGVPVRETQFFLLPKRFLVNGEHVMVIKSYQRRGRFFFISGTVREKNDEYKMIVSDGAIMSLSDNTRIHD